MSALRWLFAPGWPRVALGVVGGAAAGAAYANWIGCLTGSCPLTSNPLTAAVMGALVGASALWPGPSAQQRREPPRSPKGDSPES